MRCGSWTVALLVGGVLAACGGGSSGGGTKAKAYAIGGTVTGLTGGGILVLQDNAADSLVLTADGAFTFGARVAGGAAYSVAVAASPAQPRQTCAVDGGSGTVGDADVTSVAVTCTTNSYLVGGAVIGLQGAGLTLRNNGGDDTAVPADGAFAFPTAVASGQGYAVTVQTQPSAPAQTCVVVGGTGTVGGAEVASVTVNCSTDLYTVGGTVSGLSGTGLVLQDEAAADLPVSGNGTFAFWYGFPDGFPYGVTVASQPTSPWQTCSVSNGAGTIGGASVADVAVDCVTNTYGVSVTVSGLAGSGLVLQDNGGDDLTPKGNGTFTFASPVASGQPYDVEVVTPPASPDETCTVAHGTGTVAGADVGVTVSCGGDPHLVQVTVTGLTGTGLVLRNAGGDDLAVDADGTYAFATAVRAYNDYDVEVATQPTSQACLVAGGAGTLPDGDVTATVTCYGALSNGDLEDGLTGWTTFGWTPPLIDPGVSHGGLASVLMYGDDSSAIYQDLLVPAGSPTLSFWVARGTSDDIYWDQQYAEIRDLSGNVLETIFRTCENSGWTQVTHDMSAYAGQVVRLTFRVAGDSCYDDTWQWIDDVELN
jgi:large repetitive protein